MVAATGSKSTSAQDQIVQDKHGNDMREKSSEGMPASLCGTRRRIAAILPDIAQPKRLPIRNQCIPLLDEGKDRTL